ncbi:LexA family protein [Streptomyces yaizuensis]|uniref:LexA repressor n=1 Tax=Streptomyces yaizuensis TaxID=2989713 RepID=A0ABQ5P6P1_9ACTN|nr:LexA repressor [Streptomyces sp. YSPA8]GLF98246.1 LexA repressor [Streptomyces sp. YSPA8]
MTVTTPMPRTAGRPGRPPGDRNTGPDGLTIRQADVVDSILSHVERYGFPPSMRQIGAAVGLSSTSSVAHQLLSLERLGVLGRDPHRPRAYRVRPLWLARHRPEVLDDGTDTVWVPLLPRPATGAADTGGAQDLLPLPRALVGASSPGLFAVRAAVDAPEAAIRAGDILVACDPDTTGTGDLVLVETADGTLTAGRLPLTSTARGTVRGRVVFVVRTL